MWSRFILFFFASINKDIGIPWIFSMSAWKGIITRNRIYLRQTTINSSELRNGLIQISRCVFVTNIFQRPFTYIASVGVFYLRSKRIYFLIIALHSRHITIFNEVWYMNSNCSTKQMSFDKLALKSTFVWACIKEVKVCQRKTN